RRGSGSLVRAVPFRDGATRFTGGVAIAAAGAAGAVALALLIATATASRSHTGDLLLVSMALAFVALIVGNARRFLLTLVVFDVALQWDVNLDYDFDAAKLGAFGGVNLSITTLALAGLYAFWFVDQSTTRIDRARLRVRPALPLIIYIGIAGI